MRELRTAACLAVGSELLGESAVDSNSLVVTRLLARRGVEVREKRAVGDDEGDISRALLELLDRYDLVVVTGGLGPTADDLTRRAVARVLGRELRNDPMAEGWVRERYASLGREMPEICRSMAEVVEGTRPLHNRCGAAPGIYAEAGGKVLLALPGVPHEMEPMLHDALGPELDRRGGGRVRATRTLLLGGVMESEVEGRVRPLWERFGPRNLTVLASPGVVTLALVATGEPTEAAARLDEMERAFRAVLGDDVAGVDVGGLEHVVVAGLAARGETVAVAESCTGGLLGAALTEVPGASSVFEGGVVCYSNRAKEALVGVPASLIAAYGAVSEAVARALATGVRERFAADYGIGVTGIAGPGGGSPDKPVGLVHWAIAGPEGVEHRVRVFGGGRAAVRRWSVNAALDLLRRTLMGAAPPVAVGGEVLHR